MRISIFGLGYVGVVSAACFSKDGHEVLGIDVSEQKVDMITAGRSPIVEPGLEKLIADARKRGRIRATTNAIEGVMNTDISLICVGTPSNGNGSLDLQGVEKVSHQIGEALRQKKGHHCVVFRSTMLPGTVRARLLPILAKTSQKQVHHDYDVCFNPEFLREGTSISDFYRPPFTLIGQETERGGEMVARLYGGVDAPVERTSYEIAEMVKYACNSFHAVKVAFANEIGVLCKALGMDGYRVMEIFARDKKLNISPAYLRPGFAFGGSCLPKDLRAILYRAKEMDVSTPLLGSALESNRLHIQRTIERIMSAKRKSLGFLGLSFKRGTDDLRESPIVPVIETLLGKGYRVRIHDSEVQMASLFGANRQYIEHEIPHISSLLRSDLDEVIRESEVIIVSKSDRSYVEAMEPYLKDKIIVDLVRLPLNNLPMAVDYDGVCW